MSSPSTVKVPIITSASRAAVSVPAFSSSDRNRLPVKRWKLLCHYVIDGDRSARACTVLTSRLICCNWCTTHNKRVARPSAAHSTVRKCWKAQIAGRLANRHRGDGADSSPTVFAHVWDSRSGEPHCEHVDRTVSGDGR